MKKILLAIAILGAPAFADNDGCEEFIRQLKSGQFRTTGGPVAKQKNLTADLHAYWRRHVYEKYSVEQVQSAYVTLTVFLMKDPISFFEYVQLCRNSDHKVYDGYEESLLGWPELVTIEDGRLVVNRVLADITLALTNGAENSELAILEPPEKL